MEQWQGQGAYGAVYRAARVSPEHSGPFALKVSLYPWDARFAREAELLSRLNLPGVPRLLDRGVLRHPSGEEHFWFVMEWVEGTPLYAWAQQHSPSLREMCQVLAQLARTLEALHASGVVHRDVKGDNVLVRLSDRFPVLIDFGSGHLQGAPRLTWQSLPPGTYEYLSVQACRFEISLARHRDGYYPPSPADDLYALGVTAYRLVMGQYPPPLDALEDEVGAWHVISPDLRSLLAGNPRVPPRLREVILGLLAELPEARGTAAQAATALEAVASEPVPPPAAEVPPPSVPAAPNGIQRPERVRPSARQWAWKPWLAAAAVAGFAVLLWNVAPVRGPPQQRAADFQKPDAGTSAVGDSSPTGPRVPTPPSQEKKPVAQGPLPEPLSGQIKPDKSGQCPGRKQVLINGACWLEQLQLSAQECVENNGVLFKSKCYAPVFASPRKAQPTSSPPEER
ncbi:MAG TPA: serine/threonine-protein kinase [Myxococcaceae bacterium]|nr:serine/threonine-protein kinase [Myxococcaceae bacterium]